MNHDNPYDQAASDCADEDRRQALQDAGEDEMNERRQLRKRGPPDDLTTNETRSE